MESEATSILPLWPFLAASLPSSWRCSEAWQGQRKQSRCCSISYSSSGPAKSSLPVPALARRTSRKREVGKETWKTSKEKEDQTLGSLDECQPTPTGHSGAETRNRSHPQCYFEGVPARANSSHTAWAENTSDSYHCPGTGELLLASCTAAFSLSRHPPPSRDKGRVGKAAGPLAQQTQQLCSRTEDNQDDFWLHRDLSRQLASCTRDAHTTNSLTPQVSISEMMTSFPNVLLLLGRRKPLSSPALAATGSKAPGQG